MAKNLPTAEENLCEICNSAYTSPRLLDCFHIFCTPCLEKLIEGEQTFRCPLCRRDLPVPIEGIKSVPFFPYTTKSNSVKKNKTERTCEMCDEIEIYSRCIDCDQNMCKSCHDYHLRNKTLRKHTLVEENTEVPTKQDEIQPKDMQCGEHVKEFSFYCKSCNSLICEECKKSKHVCHKIEDLNYAAKNMILSLTSVVTSISSKIPFLNNTIENAKTEKKKYQTHIDQTKTELQRSASNLKEWMCTSVDMILSDSLQNIESLSNSDKKTLQTYTEEAELRRIALIKFRKTIEGIVNCGIKCKIVKFGSAICTQSKIYDDNYSLSGMVLKFPKYNPGTLSFDHIKDFFGSVKADENTTVLPTVRFPCIQTIGFVNIKSFAQEIQLKVEYDVKKITAAGRYHVCVAHENILSDYSKHLSEVTAYDLIGKSKVISTPRKLIGNNLEFIGTGNSKCFIWLGSSIETLQMETGDETNSRNFLQWEYEIPHLSEHGRACILDNGNIIVFINNNFYEIEETGKTVRTFSSTHILENHSQKQANCILFTKTKTILIAFYDKIIAKSISGDFLHSHKHEKSYCNFVSMCEDRHGNVFVADSYNRRICLISSDGNFIRNVLTFSTFSLTTLRMTKHTTPMSITIDGNGNLWVLDDSTITVYSYL